MCTVLLPPGVNPIAVIKYINIKECTVWDREERECMREGERLGE
jgi:hypothetical protein